MVTSLQCEALKVTNILTNLAPMSSRDVQPKHAFIFEAAVKTVSGHFTLVLGAQYLLVRGASLPQIMAKGGWVKTDPVMR